MGCAWNAFAPARGCPRRLIYRQNIFRAPTNSASTASVQPHCPTKRHALIGITAAHKCPTFTTICAYIRQRQLGRAAPMTAQFKKTTDEEFEVQLRNLVRLVSACTLGLWSFSAGLLIGTFYLF